MRFPRTINPYERLKQAIMVGELRPGEQLVESTLAEWYEVSRTPVREALTRLEQDRLVQRSERGLTVRDSRPEEVLDVYDCRVVLEVQAAVTAAKRRTDADIFSMRRAAEEFACLPSDDPADLARANRAFHRTLWHASHNAALLDLHERISLHLGRSPASTLSYPGQRERASHEHLELVAAIEERNAQLAGNVAHRHLETAREIRLKLWQQKELGT